MNANIALSKAILNWIRSVSPLALMIVVLPILVLTTNVSAWLVAKLSRQLSLMPYFWRTTWIETECLTSL